MTHRFTAVRRIARILNGGTPTPDEANWGGDVPWATPIDIGAHHGRRITASLRHLTAEGALSGSTIAPADSILLSTRAPIGYVAQNEVAMAFNQGCKALVPRNGVDTRFLNYALLHSADEMAVLGQGSTFAEISGTALAGLKVPLPSQLDEQRQIAEYLDRETGQIDALIAKQEQLVETLTERRQAVIAQAVTRGLDPDVEMRDSGVYWLRDVPVHWAVRKFSQVADINGGQVDPREEPYRSMTLIAPNHIEKVTGRLLKMESAADQGADSGKYFARRGQVIYSKIRPGLRKATVAPHDCLCSADMYSISGQKALLRDRFLHLLLLSAPFANFVLDVSARVAMPKINREALATAVLWFPSLDEQDHILSHLDNATTRIDALIAKAREMTAVLRERRQALISAAVTGKIDVRGL